MTRVDTARLQEALTVALEAAGGSGGIPGLDDLLHLLVDSVKLLSQETDGPIARCEAAAKSCELSAAAAAETRPWAITSVASVTILARSSHVASRS